MFFHLQLVRNTLHKPVHEFRFCAIEVALRWWEAFPIEQSLLHYFIQLLPLLFTMLNDSGEAMIEPVTRKG